MQENALFSIPNTKPQLLRSPFLFWGISLLFLLFQFFIQLSSGMVMTAIMHDFALTASEVGLLSSAYYYVYTALQIPVGMLFDRKNTRVLITVTCLISSIGCLLFAISPDFISLMVTRLLIGASSAFAFVGLSHILRQHFKPQQFGVMIGLSETLAFLATVIFMLVMGTASHSIQWRHIMLNTGYIGLVITLLSATLLPRRDTLPVLQGRSIWKELYALCANKTAWINGAYISLGFTLITVFGAMWAIPFIQLKTGCSLLTAGLIDAMLFLGAGLSCPLFGILDARTSHRKTLLFLSYVITAIVLTLTLFAPMSNLWALGGCFGLMGLTSGAYMLGYSIANDISPPESQSTSTGFANTLAMLSAPLLQPVVGYVLDALKTHGTYGLEDYQFALTIVPLCLLLGAVLVVFLPSPNRNR